MKNQEGIKIELQKKVHRKICVKNITFSTAAFLSCYFLLLSSSTPSHFSSDVLAEGPLHNVIMGIMLCEDIMSERFFSISSFFSNYFSAFRYFVYRIKTHEISQTVLISTVRLWLTLCVRFLTRSQFQKVCLLHDGTFHPIHLLQTLSILFYHFACVIH